MTVKRPTPVTPPRIERTEIVLLVALLLAVAVVLAIGIWVVKP